MARHKKIERQREIERRRRRREKLAKLRAKGLFPRPEGYDPRVYSYVAYAVAKGIMTLDEALARLEKAKIS
ncbi:MULTISPECIES: hypothetical protein [Thermodesulfobacterium]|jgi:hypothetical protein|uniref:Uncharacterized protein n=1 Tax=Thermodesulfobacterium commune TaxID=1741 RepID=A0A101FK88_9BACT|nr:hypothetical protein [Thermodesulfobacterium sp.]KUJ97824.1 MAG: Uncharacterized protein XD42_0525 [Thermodesulfobacterium sp. 37_54]KUK19274.1 MAG: Uncharacterized protein XD55_0669 [Thermodesulfobacterium commune]KUK38567.1 MAG: Uncharacterized protein XD67_0164 [Thermodesulfobacterium commune]MBZ4681962.1 hypothetical protein [Thermodesulfobacterium sp.]MDK2861126.1 hypothetical protein [Thermodesulfobacterium sp.]